VLVSSTTSTETRRFQHGLQQPFNAFQLHRPATLSAASVLDSCTPLSQQGLAYIARQASRHVSMTQRAILVATSGRGESERDAFACIMRHQAFAMAPVRERDTSACVGRHQAFALASVMRETLPRVYAALVCRLGPRVYGRPYLALQAPRAIEQPAVQHEALRQNQDGTLAVFRVPRLLLARRAAGSIVSSNLNVRAQRTGTPYTHTRTHTHSLSPRCHS